jgi:hypothetical protein
MELSKDIVNLALGMDMWIFGGYVRDVIVRNQQKFVDIDIGCPDDTTDVDQFLRILSTRYTLTLQRDRKFPLTDYGQMTRVIRRLHKCVVYDTTRDQAVKIDIVVVDSFRSWCKDHTADFTCNLFYMKSDVALGLRYIPDYLMYDPNPVDTLIKMTKDGDFRRVWDVPEGRERQWMNVIRIHERAKELVKRGFHLREQIMSGDMSLEILGRDYAVDACDRAMRIIETLQNRRAARALRQCKGTDSVTQRVEEILWER